MSNKTLSGLFITNLKGAQPLRIPSVQGIALLLFCCGHFLKHS